MSLIIITRRGYVIGDVFWFGYGLGFATFFPLKWGFQKGIFIRGTPIKSKIIPWSSQKMISFEWQAGVAAFELYAITQDQDFDPTAPLTEFRSLKRYSKA